MVSPAKSLLNESVLGCEPLFFESFSKCANGRKIFQMIKKQRLPFQKDSKLSLTILKESVTQSSADKRWMSGYETALA